MSKPKSETRCWRCGLDESALVHHATANGHGFNAPYVELDDAEAERTKDAPGPDSKKV